jgi:hypothetical protein
VEGAVASEAIYWAPRGTGNGGNNCAGAGVLVAPDFKGMRGHVCDGELAATGKMIEDFTADQRKHYGFDQSSFPEASSGRRVVVLLSSP